MEAIKTGKFVACTYELLVGEEQELMEKATPEVPLTFVYGVGEMLPAFEAKLEGMEKGDKFDFTLSAEDAYGEYDDEHVIELGKDMFMVDGQFDEEIVTPGNVVPMMDAAGNRLNATVVEVKDDVVVLDFNHPLAGENLHFIGEVAEVREATEEELNPAGSCGGGCSSCGCGDGCEDSGCNC